MTRSAAEGAVLEAVPRSLLIGGEWRPARTGGTLPVEDPATAEPLTEVADASEADAMDALAAAHDAQPEWAATPPRQRSEILRRAYEAIVARTDDLALLMTLEMGKPLADSRAEVAYSADFFRWFAEEAVRIGGDYRVGQTGATRVVTMRQPVGPVLLITPWNFPLAMATRKIGPAIAAGCTMVLKPASLTPLSALACAEILQEAGLPPGVLNVVTTSKSGPTTGPLMADSRLRKLSFTGSTEVGQKLVEQSASQLLRLSMELGGNAPFLVFADADVAAAVEGAMLAKLRNGGEACTAANRFYVHRSVAEPFLDGLAERMARVRVGRGTDDGVGLGPMIDAGQRDKIAELVDDATAQGATARYGGQAVPGAGYFYQPTVLADVPSGARLLHEEIFGPVAPVVVFDDDDEALRMANDTEFGLVAYVYTANLDRALRVAEQLETGMVGLNRGMVSDASAPFGGVKHSGFGREGGAEGIEEYLAVKYVAIQSWG
jgi:succinate-semialdehyde dehydrogenase / glutarate-semialdehyde dehydrogenase